MIIEETLQKRYYQALLEKDTQFDGVFYVGITTTGIFCHPSCRAKKPKYEHCVFYQYAEEALLSGFRPCKICHPLSFPQSMPDEVRLLVEAVEQEPEKRWKEEDFKELGIHSATARRKFKDYYHMTFVQYARSRRMGLALKNIEKGQKVIDQQLATGYQSASGFNDAFTRIMGNPATKLEIKLIMGHFIMTPLGRMLALADDEYLYLLEFDNRRGLEREIETFRKRYNARIIYGENDLLRRLKQELGQYFAGELEQFTIPIHYSGSDFQKSVWNLLRQIPLGETRTYKDLALLLGDAHKVRAVGNANGANQLSILVPCHRVIATNGELGGYGGGVERKQYLLELEKRMAVKPQY